MCVDRTGCSKGEVNTASGDSIRFLLRSPSSPALGRRGGSLEGNSGGKRTKDISNGISWRNAGSHERERKGRESVCGAGTCDTRSRVSNTMFLLAVGALDEMDDDGGWVGGWSR